MDFWGAGKFALIFLVILRDGNLKGFFFLQPKIKIYDRNFIF